MLLGLSGDKIIIEGNTILKICLTDQNRFLKNINKQKHFYSKYIESVPIIEEGIIDNKYFIRMPFIINEQPGEKEFVNILKYLGESFKNSNLMTFNKKIWIDKIEDLQFKIKDKAIIQILENIKHFSSNYKIPYGLCHGDLSFDNLLFSKGKVYVIDFLDCFINTPILDICKLRQSSKHNWNEKAYMLKSFDKQLEVAIQKNNILSEYYYPFQILNLCRIIPYSKDNKMTLYLKREINELNRSYNSGCGKK